MTALRLIGCTQFSDVGLTHVGRLQALNRLSLSDCTQIGDAGLAHVGRLRALNSLDLCGCSGITDAGLEHLRKLPALKSVDLSWGPLVTQAGVDRLRLALPSGAEVDWSPPAPAAEPTPAAAPPAPAPSAPAPSASTNWPLFLGLVGVLLLVRFFVLPADMAQSIPTWLWVAFTFALWLVS